MTPNDLLHRGMQYLTLAALVTLMAASCGPTSGSASALAATMTDGDVVIRQGDSGPFATVRLRDTRVPYLWPIVGPSGQEMTRAFPMDTRPGEAEDHPHHQSLWLTHGSVNGHDFWHDPKCTIGLRGEPVLSGGEGDFDVKVLLPLVWQAEGHGEVLRETRVLRFGEFGGQRLIEVSSTLEASAGDVVFGDTKEGTFGIRVRPELRHKGSVARGKISNSEGQVDGDVWGKRARWVAYEAPVEGERVAICVMDHPSNLRHPTWWHARDYGLVAANPFGAHDFTGAAEGEGDYLLPAGSSITQRYLVVLAASEESMPMGFEDVWLWWQR